MVHRNYPPDRPFRVNLTSVLLRASALRLAPPGRTDCGAAAAKRSSNESNGGTLAGAAITGAGSSKAATMVSAADGALLTAKAGRLITGESKLVLLSSG